MVVIKFMVTILLLIIIGVFVTVALIGHKKLRGFNEYPLFLNQTIVVILLSIALLLFGLVVEFTSRAEIVYGSSDSVRCGMCTSCLYFSIATVLLHTIAMNFLFSMKSYYYSQES